MAAVQDEKIHHMRVTAAGQISLPAAVRRRWGASRVRITDLGDRLIVEPLGDHPFSSAIGVLAGGPLTSDDLLAEREADRAADAERWPRRTGQGSS